jgi:hypothetical protein
VRERPWKFSTLRQARVSSIGSIGVTCPRGGGRPEVTHGKPAEIAAALTATLVLLAPALWNGFPLLEHDTGGYLARWFEGTLEVSRSTVYGLFLVALAWADFWPAVAVQAALTVWVIALLLRAHGLGGRPLVLLITVTFLSVATTLPWIASILLTDIFAGLGVLALYLMVLCARTLARWERSALVVLVAFSAATHNATLAVLLALMAVAVIVALLRGLAVPRDGLGRGVAALLIGAVLLVSANLAVAGRLAWTPGGVALSFGRMLQDGIVARFLAEHCPDPRFRLCAHRDELPSDADVFLWGESVFDRLGRFEGLGEEMRTIVLESIAAYPVRQIEAAAQAAVRQLVKVRTGEGVLDSIWHTHWTIEHFTPSALAAMRAARQQKGELDFAVINRLHVPVALVSMVLLAAMIVPALRRPCWADLGVLAAAAAVAVLANAAVCGVLANPHDRYGARMAWIATLVVALVPWRALLGEPGTGNRAGAQV